MERILNNETDVEAIMSLFDGETQQIVKIEAGTDIEKVKDLLKQTSDLPDNGFRFFTIRLKELSSEDKAELIKYAIKEELRVTSIIETLVLMVNSSNNYNPEFFNAPDVLFSSVVDYLDICDLLEEEINTLRQKIGFYFLAVMKSYVNHPRFVMNESSNYETMPAMYEYILMLLDFFNISFILNTPSLEIPAFSEIPSNLKTDIKLIDLWADKQKFVVSTLSELSKTINEKLEEAKNQ